MKPVKQVLIVNFHSAENAGDLALLQQSLRYLREAYGELKFSVLANWPEEAALKELGIDVLPSAWALVGAGRQDLKPRHQVLAFLKGFFYLFLWRLGFKTKAKSGVRAGWEAIFEAVKGADLVAAVAGNQMFSSSKKSWPLPAMIYPLWLAEALGRRTLVLPQSVGPFSNAFDSWMVRRVYNKVGKVFVRDEISFELVKALGIRESKPEIMPDIAFTYPSGSAEAARELLERYGWAEGQRCVGLTVIAPMPSYLKGAAMADYYAALASAMRTLMQKGWHFYLFNQVTGPSPDEDDRTAARELLRGFSGQELEQVHHLDQPMGPAELKAAYGLMDVFIASRLHSGVFSLAMNCPTLFIGYLHKTRGVLQPLGLEDRVCEIGALDSGRLSSKLKALLEDKDSEIERLKEINHSIQTALEHLPEKLRELRS